eukprot:1158672-Pelagomonas_calceolata.AAC.2
MLHLLQVRRCTCFRCGAALATGTVRCFTCYECDTELSISAMLHLLQGMGGVANGESACV